jgi:hypothetical protein
VFTSKDTGESAIPDEEEEEADKTTKDKRLVSVFVKETLDGPRSIAKKSASGWASCFGYRGKSRGAGTSCV